MDKEVKEGVSVFEDFWGLVAERSRASEEVGADMSGKEGVRKEFGVKISQNDWKRSPIISKNVSEVLVKSVLFFRICGRRRGVNREH